MGLVPRMGQNLKGIPNCNHKIRHEEGKGNLSVDARM
jgi:hypothetical protein